MRPVPILEIQTAEGIRIRTELAGAGSRTAAGLLDLILIFAGYLLVLLLLLAANALMQESGVGVFEGISSLVLGIVAGGLFLLPPIYFTVFHSIWNGQTPGKRMLHIRVVDASGTGAGLSAHLMRSMLWLVDVLLMIPIPIGLILIAVTPRCRRLGDLAAGTMVLCESRASAMEEPWADQSWDGIEQKMLDLSAGMAAKLGEEDLSLMRDAIGRRDVPRQTRQRIYRELVAHYAERLGFSPHENPRVSLKELYLFARQSRNA